MEVFRRIFSDQGVFQSIDQEVDFVIENDNIDNCVNEILRKIKYFNKLDMKDGRLERSSN